MTLFQDPKKKPTRALYKRIYRAHIAGLNHAGLREAFKVSQATVERAIEWCRKIGMDAIPEKDPLVQQTIEDISMRRASLVNKLASATNINDLCKLNDSIGKLDDKRLSLKGVIVHRESFDFKELSEKSDEEIDRIIKEDMERNSKNKMSDNSEFWTEKDK